MVRNFTEDYFISCAVKQDGYFCLRGNFTNIFHSGSCYFSKYRGSFCYLYILTRCDVYFLSYGMYQVERVSKNFSSKTYWLFQTKQYNILIRINRSSAYWAWSSVNIMVRRFKTSHECFVIKKTNLLIFIDRKYCKKFSLNFVYYVVVTRRYLYAYKKHTWSWQLHSQPHLFVSIFITLPK